MLNSKFDKTIDQSTLCSPPRNSQNELCKAPRVINSCSGTNVIYRRKNEILAKIVTWADPSVAVIANIGIPINCELKCIKYILYKTAIIAITTVAIEASNKDS